MLNELYSMQRGLKKVGESPPIKHNDIKSPGMGSTIRIILASDGNVSRIEWLNRDKIKDTWSIGDGYKNQFPAIKLTYPLIHALPLLKNAIDSNIPFAADQVGTG